MHRTGHAFDKSRKPTPLAFAMQISVNPDCNHCLNSLHLKAIAHSQAHPSLPFSTH